MKLTSGLKANISNVRKITIVPKHGSNLTVALYENILLQFVVIPCMEDYFSAYLVCMETHLHIENYSEFQFANMQKFHSLGSVEECFCS